MSGDAPHSLVVLSRCMGCAYPLLPKWGNTPTCTHDVLAVGRAHLPCSPYADVWLSGVQRSSVVSCQDITLWLSLLYFSLLAYALWWRFLLDNTFKS